MLLPLQSNRAFLYGDGVFETLRVSNHRIFALNYHYERLSQGLVVLGLKGISLPDFRHIIETHINTKSNANLRVRIAFFRQGSGAYLPAADCQTQYFIQSAPLHKSDFVLNEKPIQMGVCPNIRLSCDVLANIKTSNALPYIVAARYAQEQGWDDAFLLNQYGRVAEATNANVFIVKDETIFTPPLTEGCVAGVMRRCLIDLVPVVQQPITTEDIENANEIWLTNVIRGLQIVRPLPPSRLAQQLNSALNEWG